jgi:hypothetical protein
MEACSKGSASNARGLGGRSSRQWNQQDRSRNVAASSLNWLPLERGIQSVKREMAKPISRFGMSEHADLTFRTRKAAWTALKFHFSSWPLRYN